VLFNKYVVSLQTGNTLELALGAGMNVDSVRSKQGRTLLMYAAEYGSVSDVELLLAMGADVKAEDNFAWTPLLLACQHGYPEIVEVLIRSGADTSAKTKGGVSPMYFACSRGHFDIVRMLLVADVTPDPGNLHSALAYGHTACASLLIDAGVDVNMPNDRGWTPLLVSSSSGNTHMVTRLLNAGADPNYMNKKGLTPLRIACAKGHGEVAHVLLAFGAVKDIVSSGSLMNKFESNLDIAKSKCRHDEFDWTTYNRNAKYLEKLSVV